MEELPCFCINLDSRPERWEQTKKSFEGTGLVLQRFNAIKHAEGWRGCGESHVALAREAMRKGLPWILILEDDCEPVADFSTRWPIVKMALWEQRHAWDMFLGGPTAIKGPIETIGEHLTLIDGAYALHFYLLNASGYERAIAWNPDRHGPIDVYYSDQFRIAVSQPLLAIQRQSMSDIEEEEVDYSHYFNQSALTLQQLQYSFHTRSGTLALVMLSAIVLGCIWLKKGGKK